MEFIYWFSSRIASSTFRANLRMEINVRTVMPNDSRIVGNAIVVRLNEREAILKVLVRTDGSI